MREREMFSTGLRLTLRKHHPYAEHAVRILEIADDALFGRMDATEALGRIQVVAKDMREQMDGAA